MAILDEYGDFNEPVVPAIMLFVDIEEDFANFIVSKLKKGYQNPTTGKVLTPYVHEYIKNKYGEKFRLSDHKLVASLIYDFVVHFNKKIGSCSKGYYLIKTEKDAQITIDYLMKKRDPNSTYPLSARLQHTIAIRNVLSRQERKKPLKTRIKNRLKARR